MGCLVQGPGTGGQLMKWPANLGQFVEPRYVVQSVNYQAHAMLHVQVSDALRAIWA